MRTTKNCGSPIVIPKFFSVNCLCDWLEVSKSFLSKAEREGLLARRAKLPDGSIGWSASQVFAWFYREEFLADFLNLELSGGEHGPH